LNFIPAVRLSSTPYRSDLDFWLADIKEWIDDKNKESYTEDPRSKFIEAVKKLKSDTRKALVDQARCTYNVCAMMHPWAVRRTLHPWKLEKSDPSKIDGNNTSGLSPSSHSHDFSVCPICKGESGKGRDGGLFTGETLLHIAIVANDRDRYLLCRPPSCSYFWDISALLSTPASS